MIIHSARYLGGPTTVDRCPATQLPEFAFIGRSNVGKSSLINLLTQNGKLALTSSKPGKTILINHFLINDKWFLVDLPGYGYAKRSKELSGTFGQMIRDYILKRPNLDLLFVLIDSNVPPQAIDLNFINWLAEHEIPFHIIFTKADKLSKAELKRNVEAFCQALGNSWEQLPPYFTTSATRRIGREQILQCISDIIKHS